MIGQPELSESEWALVIELLEQEQRELPSEVRRTRTASVRDSLREREATVKSLLDRLHGTMV